MDDATSARRIETTVPDPLAGERLDRVVAMLGDCSRSRAAELISAGGVTLDGSTRTQRSTKVLSGQLVAFDVPESMAEAVPQADATVEVPVLHEDPDVIIVDKPVGLVVHPGAGRPDGTMVNGLLARYPELSQVGQPERPGIVHRLDADTSGLLAVARSHRAYEGLTSALAQRSVTRVYRAVVHGAVVDDRGVIDAPIGRSSKQRTKMAVTEDGRSARTAYEVLARSDDRSASVLRCRLETGRTHQIRVHLSAIGHAVIADSTYGSRTNAMPIERVALHAESLGFDHPDGSGPVLFTSPVPEDMVELCRRLGLEDAVGC